MTPIVILFGVWSVLAVAAPSERPLDVCEVIRRGPTLDSQIVRVRGMLTKSGSRLPAPLNEMVADCTDSAGNVNKVRLQVQSPDWHFLQHPPRGFKTDKASVRRAEEVIEKAQSSAVRAKRVYATVEGYLVVPVQSTDTQVGSRRPRHPRYPAYIIIQAIRDVIVQ